MYRHGADPESTLLSSIWCEHRFGQFETNSIIESVWGKTAPQNTDISILQKGLPNPPSTRYISGQILKSVEREKHSLPLMALALNHLGAYYKTTSIRPPDERFVLYRMTNMEMYISIGAHKTSSELSRAVSGLVTAWTQQHHALWYCQRKDYKRLKCLSHPLKPLMKAMGVSGRVPSKIVSKLENPAELYARVLENVRSSRITLSVLAAAGLPSHLASRMHSEYCTVNNGNRSKAATTALNCLDESQRVRFFVILHCISEKLGFDITVSPPMIESVSKALPLVSESLNPRRSQPIRRGSRRTKRVPRASKNASTDPRVLVCIDCMTVCTAALGQKRASLQPPPGAIVDTCTHKIHCGSCYSTRVRVVDTSKYTVRCQRVNGDQPIVYMACRKCKTPCVNTWTRLCHDCKTFSKSI